MTGNMKTLMGALEHFGIDSINYVNKVFYIVIDKNRSSSETLENIFPFIMNVSTMSSFALRRRDIFVPLIYDEGIRLDTGPEIDAWVRRHTSFESFW